ncbi:DUF6716 putative glycosyltransferase [Neorhizobium alkalisoli]|uniref:DUF6716 putative glycosyltransferase n=1 Tax=Neorhizobium alkalisoli TaxID=528178 RepID=UPI000CF8AB30|nr:DUF6716 putative glycosyltransferase [Neorhizobium alkalisoli]
MRCLALASYDSFLNVARLIAQHFQEAGCSVDYALVRARKSAQITDQQVQALAYSEEVKWISLDAPDDRELLAGYDIILSCLEGLSTRRLMHYAQLFNRRPLIISAYPGLVLRYANDGFSMRTGCDLLWLNSKVDLEAYTEMCAAFALPFDNARVFGIASLLKKPKRSLSADSGPIVFFEQAVIPRYKEERVFLCEQLIGLAQRFPQYQFLLKPRTMGREATLHKSWSPIVPLLNEATRHLGKLPANLEISARSASDLLEVASHCLTVSSTVAAEAVNAGVPTAIVADFGAHEDYGLHYFFKSGLITSFRDLAFPFQKQPDPDWVQDYLTDPINTVHDLVLEAVEMVSGRRRTLTSQLLKAEMSPSLRDHLYASNGVESTLSRQHQSRPSNATQLWRKLLRGYRARRTRN